MILLSQCYAQMKISFPGLIFAQYKSIKLLIINYDAWLSAWVIHAEHIRAM